MFKKTTTVLLTVVLIAFATNAALASPVGPPSVITIAAGAKVKNLVVNGPAVITGPGIIEIAWITANGVTLEQKPQSLEVAQGVSAMVAGKEVTGIDRTNSVSSGGDRGDSGGTLPKITLQWVGRNEDFVTFSGVEAGETISLAIAATPSGRVTKAALRFKVVDTEGWEPIGGVVSIKLDGVEVSAGLFEIGVLTQREVFAVEITCWECGQYVLEVEGVQMN